MVEKRGKLGFFTTVGEVLGFFTAGAGAISRNRILPGKWKRLCDASRGESLPKEGQKSVASKGVRPEYGTRSTGEPENTRVLTNPVRRMTIGSPLLIVTRTGS